jgi:hypothetical protein
VLKAMAPEIPARYQRAGELLEEILAARSRASGRTRLAAANSEDAEEIQTRLKARETLQPRFCWHCRKPLHARADRCPFCGEAQ